MVNYEGSFFEDREAMLWVWRERIRAKSSDLQLIWRGVEVFFVMWEESEISLPCPILTPIESDVKRKNEKSCIALMD